MSQTIPLPNEFSTTTQSSREKSSHLKVVGSYSVESTTTDTGLCEVILIDQSRPRESILPKHVSIEELESRLKKYAGFTEEMATARNWVSETIYPNQLTLRSLRLSQGLTQTMLARAIGTSQPHLARMENGQGDIMRETMRRLCSALNVDMNTLDKALQAFSTTE